MLRLLLNASTHQDFFSMYQALCAQSGISPSPLENEYAPVRILYANNIVEVNELLIKYMFPWAHGIITKPSGDMAYDTAASGAFCLFLQPLGDWEVNIRDRFELLDLGTSINPHRFLTELDRLAKPYYQGRSWFSTAHIGLKNIPALMLQGSTNIIHTYLDSQILNRKS